MPDERIWATVQERSGRGIVLTLKHWATYAPTTFHFIDQTDSPETVEAVEKIWGIWMSYVITVGKNIDGHTCHGAPPCLEPYLSRWLRDRGPEAVDRNGLTGKFFPRLEISLKKRSLGRNERVYR